MDTRRTIHPVHFLEHFFPVSCYLVEEKESLTLVDAGLPFSAKKIIQTANNVGKPITTILLTHGHEDHVGALDELKKLYPEIPVYISKRDSKILAGDRSLDSNEPNLPIRGGVPKKVKTKADIFIEDGDQIGSLVAVATPGHTPGSISFLDTRNNHILVGDALQTKGGIAVSGQLNLLFPFPALATWNKVLALESARKIAELKPELLVVGHGKMLKNPLPHIQKAIRQAERKLNFTT